MPFTIVRGDITQMKVDAIVNAANSNLIEGSGVCGAIFKAAGAAKLRVACRKVAPVRTGGATITPGFNLPAKYIIHAVGPIYRDWNPEQNEHLLRSAYIKSLRLAEKRGCESVAFPLISSGIYGYPKDQALQVATSAIKDFLTHHEMNIYLVIFELSSFAIDEGLLRSVGNYIDENLVALSTAVQKPSALENDMESDDIMEDVTMSDFENEVADDEFDIREIDYDPHPCMIAACAHISRPLRNHHIRRDPDYDLDDLIGKMDEPFNTTLLRLIDAKGMTDAEVYKRANIDRKLFSKIRTGNGYMPGKRTILALAVALQLDLSETDDLLERAGYALSHSQKFDVIVEYFIISGKYDIFQINEVLFRYDLPLLGAG